MNELNCASREASQRLVDAGIVLETEAAWFRPFGDTRWFLELDTDENRAKYGEYIPAPSMAELWRELPDEVDGEGLECLLNIWKNGDLTCCLYMDADDPTNTSLQKPESPIENTNPTDALIDLLIWTKGGKG